MVIDEQYSNKEITTESKGSENSAVTESRIVQEDELTSPEIKALIAQGATVTYLGEEKVYAQWVRIVTTLIGLIIGSVLFPIVGTLIGAGLGYWIANDKRKQYQVLLKK